MNQDDNKQTRPIILIFDHFAHVLWHFFQSGDLKKLNLRQFLASLNAGIPFRPLQGDGNAKATLYIRRLVIHAQVRRHIQLHTGA